MLFESFLWTALVAKMFQKCHQWNYSRLK